MNRSQRVTPAQKDKLLEYMKAHEDFARGRLSGLSGPDAVRTKKVLLEELSVTLNALGSGAQKPAEKWWKCWQDWKSDVKAKALKIKKYRNVKGGDPPPPPLTAIEEALIQFWGIEMVQGLDVIDPLEESVVIAVEPVKIEQEEILSTTGSYEELEEQQPQNSESDTRCNRTEDDPLLVSIQRQAEATERVAASMERIATAFEAASAAMVTIAAAMQQKY